jgi:phosphoglycerol transferase
MITTFFLVYSIFFLVSDYFTGYGIDDVIIYHLRYGLAGSGFRVYWLLILLTSIGVITSILIPYVIINRIVSTIKTKKTKSGMYGLIFYLFALLSFIFSPTTYGFLNYFHLYAISQNMPRNDFNKFYRSPKIKQISQKRNLVYIYAESLEKTYFDESVFPGLIKELRQLESVSTSFTQIKPVSGTGWTIGGMIASQCGIPLVTPSHGNSMSGMDAFLPNAICLGDLLSKDGYELSYFSGSSVDFAGTGKFYYTHGFNEVNGRAKLSKSLHDISYQSGWGLYDDSLFDIARNKFNFLSRKNQPFGLFLTTIDTHHPNGHPSISCKGKEYKDGNNSILNAVACSDYLIGDFVNKILKSKYAKNTVIVISSDHLAMRNTATSLLNTKDRRNLFLVIEPYRKGLKVNKPGSMLDVAPTLLPYLGYEGNIGLGRNLLGNEEALVSKISSFDAAIKAWGKSLQAFWAFPKVGFNDELLISSSDKNVIINKRAFKYPLLIEFEKNNDTIIRFQFDRSKGQKFLRNHLINMDSGKPFLWVDRCKYMNTVPFWQKRDYCIMYGRAATKNIKYSVIQENIRIPVKNIYHPLSKNHGVRSKVEIRENRYDINRFIAHAGGKLKVIDIQIHLRH